MTILQVQYVLAVAKYHSFSSAADHMYITQPALSLQIACLEKELGVPLFHRTYRGVFPTKAGEFFILHAQPLVQQWETLCRDVSKLSAQPVGHLRIMLGARVYSNSLFNSVVNFFDERQDIQATFVTDLSGNFLDEMLAERIDIALERLPPKTMVHRIEQFSIQKLIPERQCVLLPPGDALSKRSSISFRRVQGRAIVTGPEDSLEEQILLRYCEACGFKARKIYRCDNVDSLMQFIREGKGVALGPRSFEDYYQIAAVPLIPEINVSLDFICLRENEQSPSVNLLRKYLINLCQKRTISKHKRQTPAC